MASDADTPDRIGLARPEVRKVALASLIGTSIEWYDFFIYGVAAALVFNELFFPSFSDASGTLISVSTIGVAFVARPVGGIFFGHLGDRVGRKNILVVTLLVAGAATVLIGLLPTYDTIGVAAPILLVITRFAQGIGLAGEWGGAVLMAAEHAPPHRRGFYAGWPQVGVALGVILANTLFIVLTALLSADQFMSWGWRIPFLASAVLIGVGLFIRLTVMESPVFSELEASGKRAQAPLRDAVTRYPTAIIAATLGVILNLVAFYALITFMLAYTTNNLGMSRNSVLTGVLIGSGLLGVGIMVACWASDKVGRKPVIVTLYAAWLVFAFPMFWLVNTADAVLVGVAICIGMLLTSAYGPLAAFLAELFPAEVRYSAMSISFQVGAVIGGGLAPIAAVRLVETDLGYRGVALLIIAAAAVSLLAIAWLRDRSRETFAASAGEPIHGRDQGPRPARS